MTRRVPRNPRETLETFLLYEDALGLESMVRRMEWSGVTPRQVYYGVLGRTPESAELARSGPEYSARVHFLSAITSEEFQRNIIQRFLEAFPEKRREIFIHVPKCAGTDLVETIEKKLPRLNEHLPRAVETDPPTLFKELRRLVARTHCSDSIAVSGHIELVWFEEQRLIRYGDNVCAIVREPSELYLSHLNFILTRLSEFRGLRRSDTDEWLRQLDLAEMPANPTKRFLVEQAGKLLRNPTITTPNVMCHFLGLGTAQSALDRAVIYDLEITEVGRYTEWRRRRWNWDWPIRHNQSKRFLTNENLLAADLAYISEISREDQTLYEAIMKALHAAGTDCIRGTALG